MGFRAGVCALAVAASLASCGGKSTTHSSSSTSSSVTSSSSASTGAGAEAARVVPIPTFALPSKAAGCHGASPAGGGAERIPARISRVGADVGILVNVCIDGKGPFPFQVDTGASSATIDAGLADRLKLPPVGKVETFGGAGCSAKGQERRIAAWSLDGIPLRPQTATGAKVPHLGGPGQPDGLIGSDVWSAFGALRVDFRHQDLVVPGPERALPRKETIVKKPATGALPAALVHGRPRIVAPMTVDAAPSQTVITVSVAFGSHAGSDFTPDTGASTSVVDSGVARQAGLAHVALRERQNTACSVVTLPGVSSGAWSLAHTPLVSQTLLTTKLLTSGPAAGLLGADQMSRYGSVVLDYHGGRLILGAGGGPG
ncbi:MAG: retropepsin-like aspartic protease [Solirubrobacteraceae bacterium]